MSSTTSKTITELKVSAHLMMLDAGLFCVFNSPGAPPSDPVTGLPGVRLSAAPAAGGHDGAVSITGFNADGWLGGADGAALVRVSGGAAQVLVTVYQDPETQQDAPKLQVIRLTEEVAADEPMAEEPAEAAEARAIEVAAHIYGRGDVAGVLGEWMGDRGSKRWIEGFGLMPSDQIAPSDIEYQAVLGRGWLSPWSEGGQFCGSRGMSLPILGLRVRLRGAAAETHGLSVSASFVDGTEIGPVVAGETCEAPSLSPLEAFQVTLEPIAARRAPSRATAKTAAPKPVAAKPAKKAPAAPATPPVPAKRTPATTRRR
ncbi:MAG: hypothetical protein H7Z10_04965 [Gemmatimonadaceae bacterium]|nr:hypothetical protein [Acetobacteraceae bacterium]